MKMDCAELLKTKNGPLAEEDKNLIQKAYDFAKHAHEGQERKSGDPYFVHCFETAKMVARWGLDAHVVSAALLHDTAEDTKHALKKVEEEFGKEIASLVDGVTKLGHFKYREEERRWRKDGDHVADNFRKLIFALSEDIRVIFIKFADRLHNMKTLDALPQEKRNRVALETYEIYAPLAYRLGMTFAAGELEDLSLPYLFPKEYKWLIENVPQKFEEGEAYLQVVKKILEGDLKKNGVAPKEINFRTKRLSSIYKKLKKYDMDLDQIYDLVAMRIIVESVEDCYKTMGIIHGIWKPLPGRIKDYVALPKPNGYQSIHTTVFCVNQKITEFQIRTEQMNEEAQYGIAAHWAYTEAKEKKPYEKRRVVFADKKEAAWIKHLNTWQESRDPDKKGFIESLKNDFLQDRIFVVSPKGDVFDLPHGATPVDFAYHIHSEVGNECSGAKVNGRLIPLDHELRSGDVVEILRQKNKKPSDSWLRFVKTNAAKEHIKEVLRKKENLMSRLWNIRKK
ncbi:MAG: RelA/SpoT family protein [Nanoarchaeota archaeon]|nr:RelA/SpoT family protein [Nanoarchaeota archaeon]